MRCISLIPSLRYESGKEISPIMLPGFERLNMMKLRRPLDVVNAPPTFPWTMNIDVQMEWLLRLSFRDLISFCNAKRKIFNNGEEYLKCTSPPYGTDCATAFMLEYVNEDSMQIYKDVNDLLKNEKSTKGGLDNSNLVPDVVILGGTAFRLVQSSPDNDCSMAEVITLKKRRFESVGNDNGLKHGELIISTVLGKARAIRNTRADIVVLDSVILTKENDMFVQTKRMKTWSADNVVLDLRNDQHLCFSNRICNSGVVRRIVRAKQQDENEYVATLFASCIDNPPLDELRELYSLEAHVREIQRLLLDIKTHLTQSNRYCETVYSSAARTIETISGYELSTGKRKVPIYSIVTVEQGLEFTFAHDVLRDDIVFKDGKYKLTTREDIGPTCLISRDFRVSEITVDVEPVPMDDSWYRLSASSADELKLFATRNGRPPRYFTMHNKVYLNRVVHKEDCGMRICVQYQEQRSGVSKELLMVKPLQPKNLREFAAESLRITPPDKLAFNYPTNPFWIIPRKLADERRTDTRFYVLL